MDPKDPPNGPGRELAPMPVRPRALSPTKTSVQAIKFEDLQKGLETAGLKLKGVQITSGHARLQMMNARYRSTSQALGRAARTI